MATIQTGGQLYSETPFMTNRVFSLRCVGAPSHFNINYTIHKQFDACQSREDKSLIYVVSAKSKEDRNFFLIGGNQNEYPNRVF